MSEGLIERFDYFLSTMGERSLAEIKAEVEKTLDAELKPAAATEAKRLFGRYLDFKQALKAMTPEAVAGGVFEAAKARRAAILATRARFFSPAEITALFGKTDEIENDAFARAEIERNKSLTPAQKKAQLAELDAKLPAEVREGRAANAKYHSLVEAEREARAAGASEAKLLQIRTEIVGAEAAQKLAAFDQEEAAWKKRIEAYLAEKKKIMGQTGLAEADRLAEVLRLQERSFNAQERLRLGAYE